MSSDAKSSVPPTPAPAPIKQEPGVHGQGVRIFTYPKIIFIFPSMVMALICGLGMLMIKDETHDPTKSREAYGAGVSISTKATVDANGQPAARIKRFTSTQNILCMFFMGVFAFNMLIMAIDFPRFTVIAVMLLGLTLAFFFLWLNAYYDLIPALVNFLEGIYAVANAQFYFLLATIMLFMFALIYITRWLDYWEIMPNEILHHHGPLSDLERYPTLNLKFDKEIPDVLEYLFLGSGRLVLHVTEERKAIVLDNVLFINSVEAALKNLMSRMEVRVTTDQEVAEM
jgi:hypothetical protein